MVYGNDQNISAEIAECNIIYEDILFHFTSFFTQAKATNKKSLMTMERREKYQ